MIINTNLNANFTSSANTALPSNYDYSTVSATKNARELDVSTTSYEQDLYKSYRIEFGFEVNEQGILNKNFNRIANIPQSYDINVKSLQSLAKVSGVGASEMPSLVNRYYSTLSAVESEFSTDDNAMLSRDEIMSLNQGFSTKSGEFDSEISRVYEGLNQLNQARLDNKRFNTLGLDNKIIDFNFNSTISNTANNEIIKPYINQNGDVSKAGLLMNFAYADTNASSSNFLFLDAINLSFANHQQFYAMLGDERQFASFLNAQNTAHQSFDLYLYMNGVDKDRISDDKLMTLYQRYLGESKFKNMQEFVSSSSIYQAYSQILLGQFNQISADVAAQSEPEAMSAANEMRLKSIESFANSRKRQANLETIIKAYKSVMES